MTIARDMCQKGFSTPKIQIHIQTDRKMIGIIRYIKCNNFFFLPFSTLIFYQRKHQSAINRTVIRFEVFLSSINKRLVFYLRTSSHRKNQFLPDFQM